MRKFFVKWHAKTQERLLKQMESQVSSEGGSWINSNVFDPSKRIY